MLISVIIIYYAQKIYFFLQSIKGDNIFRNQIEALYSIVLWF